MNAAKSTELNDIMKKISTEIDMVINSLQFAERDLNTSFQTASLIQLCINQLGSNLKVITHNFDAGWTENK